MKLRNFDNFLLKEAENSNAQKKAVEMGLQYKGFGMWTDPRTGKITHKTEKGELIPADGASAELAGDGGGNLRPDSMDAKPGLNDLEKGPQMAPGSGVLKAPEPGTEQYPRGGNWNPGPNGDNCVNDQPPPKDLSFDMFVGKTNYVKWVAGKDGSNYKNIDYRKIASDENRSVSEVKNHSFDTFLEEEPAARAALGQPSPGNQGPISNSEKLKMQGFEHQGFNNYRRNDGTSAKIINGEIIYYNANGEVSAEDGGGLSVMGAKPTWSRPSDGQSMTPPAQPETPDEIASVPDPVPAQPPMGYDKFMNDKAIEARKAEERQTMVDLAQKVVNDKFEMGGPISRAFKIKADRIVGEMQSSRDPDDRVLAANMTDVINDEADNITKKIINANSREDLDKIMRDIEFEAETRSNASREIPGPNEPKGDVEELAAKDQAYAKSEMNFDGSKKNGEFDQHTKQSVDRVNTIANTKVDDPRFDNGRQSQKEFLDHYSKPSEYSAGLVNLNKLTLKGGQKVTDLMDAVSNSKFSRKIKLTAKESKTVGEILTEAGLDIENEDEIKSFVNAYNILNSHVNDSGTWKTGLSHELMGGSLDYFESQHIKERTDLAKASVSDIQVKAFNNRNDNNSSTQNISPKITDAVFNLMPTSARDAMNKSGSPKTYYNPYEESGQGTANSLRGSAATHMWFMQNGVDGYSLSGRVRSPGEFQVEHIVPLKKGGTDDISNFCMLLKRTNEPRADMDLKEFHNQSKKRASEVETDLNNPSVQKQYMDKKRGGIFNKTLESRISANLSDLSGEDFLSEFNENLESSIGDGAGSIKLSDREFKKYQKSMNDYLTTNNIPDNTSTKNLPAEQMNGVLNILSDSFGVNKNKMYQYMGRNMINNYDVGARFLIEEDGKLVKGRGGTQPNAGTLMNLQNSLMSEKFADEGERNKVIDRSNKNHQNLKSSRNQFIENSGDAKAYESYVSSLVETLTSFRESGNKYSKNQRDLIGTSKSKQADITKAMESLLTIDNSTVQSGKDVFSPGYQKFKLTAKTKKLFKEIRQQFVDDYAKLNNISEDDIQNFDNITKAKQKKVQPLMNILENIDRGLAR